MRRKGGIMGLGLALAIGCAGCTAGAATAGMGPPRISTEVLKGGQLLQPWLGAAIKKAATHPLGSRDNPVRADMPGGQRAYLARLRCTNDARPTWRRVGNLGAGAFGSIVDQYDVRCEGAHPPRTIIVMDMYFAGYIEARAVDGFSIAPP